MSQFELALALWITLISFATSQVPGGYYQTKYEALDVDDVLNHKRLVQHYAACLLNRGPCPPQGTDLKRILPEALDNTCMRCTEKQKYIAYRTVQRLKNEYPELYKQIVDFWDPTQERISKFELLFNNTTSDDGSQQNSVLINRFNEEASQNDLTATVQNNNAPYPPAVPLSTSSLSPSSTTRSTTVRPTTTRPTTTSTTSSSTTTRKPSASEDSTSSIVTRWKLSTTTPAPSATTRAPTPYFRPFDLPLLKARIIGDFGKVIKAGTEVAGMVLQALTRGTH